MSARKRLSPEILWLLLAFIFFFVWYTQIHPISLFDGDDWRYVSDSRSAVPIWGAWNPSRIFPEIFMPLCSGAAAYVVYPLLGNYLQAMTLTHGFVIAGFLTLYAWSFLRMMKRLFQISDATAVFSCAFFLIGHFLIFRSELTDNTYMLFCYDLTCYYYYLVPSAVNASLVMWMMGNPGFPEFLKSRSFARKGLLFFLLYLAIFSNLPSSAILAVYAGSVVLLRFFRYWKAGWKALLRENGFYLVILGIWLVSAVFELSGGRAAAAGNSLGIFARLKETVYYLLMLRFSVKKTFLAVCALIAAAAIVLLARSRRQATIDKAFLTALILCLIAIAASGIYTVVLCAAVDYSYIWRSDYLFGMFFFSMLFVSLSFGYLLKKQPRFLYAVPILLCFLTSECTSVYSTYLESNANNLDPAICDEITQDMIDAVLRAEEAGLDEAVLEVPVFDTPDNWPIPTYTGELLVNSLCEHNLLHRRIQVSIVPTAERNLEYRIPLAE